MAVYPQCEDLQVDARALHIPKNAKLGQGGFGVVARAVEDHEPFREFALKLTLDPSDFINLVEVDVSSRPASIFSVPTLVWTKASVQGDPIPIGEGKFADVGSGTLKQVMPLAVGDLADAVRQAFSNRDIFTETPENRVYTDEQALEFLRAVAESGVGLRALHNRHVAHCDIKPENILLLGRSRHGCLADFGCATRARSPENICGSRLWQPPELAPGSSVAFFADAGDWWAFAATLVWVLQMAVYGFSTIDDLLTLTQTLSGNSLLDALRVPELIQFASLLLPEEAAKGVSILITKGLSLIPSERVDLGSDPDVLSYLIWGVKIGTVVQKALKEEGAYWMCQQLPSRPITDQNVAREKLILSLTERLRPYIPEEEVLEGLRDDELDQQAVMLAMERATFLADAYINSDWLDYDEKIVNDIVRLGGKIDIDGFFDIPFSSGI